LCPFGLLQDLLHKIPLFKKRKQLPCHAVLKYGKYLVLFGLVIIGSAFLFTGFAKIPAFCKYLCPSGTFMGALPLLATNEVLRNQVGGLFFWKLGILIFIVMLSIKVYRPFCQYLCPLGAIYGWFNRFSLVQIRWEKDACISCMACKKACPVNLTPEQISVSPECIKCGQCVKACPTGCLSICAAPQKPHLNSSGHTPIHD
ncbi:MAG: 4Fe-4S binding protein, partial [Lachnospiraceae bacterium]|nr:4Fe-4S binding protein [Lachnospiraceae bacterium]